MAFEGDHDRWYAYLKDAIVEAVIGKDILQNRKVAKSILCTVIRAVSTRLKSNPVGESRPKGWQHS